MSKDKGEPTVEDARRQRKYEEARSLLWSFGQIDCLAQAIETRRAGTTGPVEDERAVANGDAPQTPSLSPITENE